MDILNTSNKLQLILFAENVEKILGIDKKEIIDFAVKSYKYYNSKGKDYKYKEVLSFDDQWYRSLKNGKPDYSVYDEDKYLGHAWACWQIYSKKYLKNILKDTSLYDRSIVSDLGEIKKIVDLGCGIGYTTRALKQIFPDAEVCGTNIEDSAQYKLCETYSEINLVGDIKDIKEPVDLVLGSEYFEHIYTPIEHLIDILEGLKPKNLLLANSFNAIALGHFPEYKHNGKIIKNSKIGRMFNQTLRDYGYEFIKTALWNNRPNYWKKYD